MVVSTVINSAETSTSSCDASGSIVFAGFINAVNPRLAAAPIPADELPQEKGLSAEEIIKSAVHSKGTLFSKPFVRKGYRDLKFGVTMAPKRDTSIVLRWMPDVSGSATTVLGSFNRLLELLETGRSFAELYVPGKYGPAARNAILDAVAANFKKLTTSDNFEMFAAAADQLPANVAKEYKVFFERLAKRKLEGAGKKDGENSSFYFAVSSKPKGSNELRKLKCYRSWRYRFMKNLKGTGLLDVLRDSAKSAKKSVNRNRSGYGSYKQILASVPEVAEEYAEMVAENPQVKVDQLVTWKQLITPYVSKLRSIRNRFEQMAQRYALLRMPNEAIIETLKPQNKELENALENVTNPNYTPVVREHLQSAMRERIQVNLQHFLTGKESKLSNLILGMFDKSASDDNLYRRLIHKFRLYKAKAHTITENRQAPLVEEIVSNGDQSIWWLIANFKQYWKNNKINISRFHTIKLESSSGMRLDNTRGGVLETEPINADSEDGIFYQKVLERIINEKLNKTFRDILPQGSQERIQFFKKLQSHLEGALRTNGSDDLGWAVTKFVEEVPSQ